MFPIVWNKTYSRPNQVPLTVIVSCPPLVVAGAAVTVATVVVVSVGRVSAFYIPAQVAPRLLIPIVVIIVGVSKEVGSVGTAVSIVIVLVGVAVARRCTTPAIDIRGGRVCRHSCCEQRCSGEKDGYFHDVGSMYSLGKMALQILRL